MNFDAKAVLMQYENGSWSEKEVRITSVEDLRKVFTPFENDVSQINLSMHEKVYYSIKFLTTGVEAKVIDNEGGTHYMVSPLLLVECDDEKPIDISAETLNNIKSAIDFY